MIKLFAIATLVVLITTVIHVAGIYVVMIFVRKRQASWINRHAVIRFIKIGSITMLMFLLTISEMAIWAFVYVLIGEFRDLEAAMYFSVTTFTTLGYGDITLSQEWRLLAAYEAANGIIIFGLTTAALIATVQQVFARAPRANANS